MKMNEKNCTEGDILFAIYGFVSTNPEVNSKEYILELKKKVEATSIAGANRKRRGFSVLSNYIIDHKNSLVHSKKYYESIKNIQSHIGPGKGGPYLLGITKNHNLPVLYRHKKEEVLIKNKENLIKKEEVLIKNEENLIKNEEKLIKNEGNLIKNEGKLIKNEEKIIKNEEKIIKNEEKLIKNELKESKIKNTETKKNWLNKAFKFVSSICGCMQG